MTLRAAARKTFVLLSDVLSSSANLVTLTLEADGGSATETLTLDSGPVKARKLKYTLGDIPFLTREQRSGVVWTGPRGEVLRADGPLFLIPVRAAGPAKIEKTARSSRGMPPRPDCWFAPQPTATGHTATLETDGGFVLATVATDKAFRPVRVENALRNGREFEAVAGVNEVRFTFAGGPEETVTVATPGRVWFLPHFFATELWEGGNGPYADLVPGDKRDGTYFPLVGAQASANAVFTLARLPDVPNPRGASADPATLRHWRYSDNNVRHDLWTDGRRLVHWKGSDGLEATRDGWQPFVANFPKPEPPPTAKPVSSTTN
jgi:hypothetical protein